MSAPKPDTAREPRRPGPWAPVSCADLARLPAAGDGVSVILIDGGPGRDWRPASARVAHTLLHAVTGDPTLRIHKDARGKPVVPDRPLHVSISHSRHVFALAVGPVTLGVDVETLRHPTRWRGLYTWITAPDERLADPRPDDFLRCWTAKEALVKLLGTGLNQGLDTLSLPPGVVRPARPDLTHRVAVAGRPCWITHLSPWGDMTVCVATARPQSIRSFVVIDALDPS